MKTNSIKNLALSILLSSLFIQCAQGVDNSTEESDKSYIAEMVQTHKDIRQGIRDIVPEIETYTDTARFVNNVFPLIESSNMHYSKMSREGLRTAKDTLIYAASDQLLSVYVSIFDNDFRALFNEYAGGEALTEAQQMRVDSIWSAIEVKDEKALSTFRSVTGLDTTDVEFQALR